MRAQSGGPWLLPWPRSCSCRRAVTLRVLTNAMRSERYGMHYELNRLIKKYQAEHENVTIELEFLPEPGEERETRLEQLRTEIMAGGVGRTSM